MKFKDFEIRPVKSLDGVIDHNRFELVKWYEHGPQEVTNSRTGEKRISTRSCFVVAWLKWNAKEPCFELISVGLRLVLTSSLSSGAKWQRCVWRMTNERCVLGLGCNKPHCPIPH